MGTSPPMGPVLLLLILSVTFKQISSQGCEIVSNDTDIFTRDLIRARVNEVDLQSTLDANRQDYRGFLGIIAPEASVTLLLGQQREPAIPEKLKPEDYFEILYFNSEPKTKKAGFFIQLKKSVDRDGLNPEASDDINSVEYELTCYEKSKPNFKSYYLVRIIFEDLNDNTPKFTKSLYTGTVNELTPIGTTVFQSLSYTDLDEGIFGRGDFAILPGDGSEFDGSTKFGIQTSATGEVSVKNVIDFEVLNAASRPVYSLNVSISDGGTPKRVSYTTLNLAITDGDDLPPEFVYESCIMDSGVCFNPLYTASVTSQLTTGPITVFPYPAAAGDASTTIQARDQDTMNHTIQFFILFTEPQGYENRFSLQPSGPFSNPPGTPDYKSILYRAQVSLTNTIDRNDAGIQAAGGVLKVVIKAQEQELNKRFNRAILMININPANSNNPQIAGTLTLPFVGYIKEDAAVGTLASSQNLAEPMRLIFTDADLTGGLTQEYDITVVPSTIFRVDENGFVRLVANGLDYENIKSYTFTVTITEKTPERRNGSATVTINVLDVNDNTPRFLSNNGRYVETVPEGTYTDTSPRIITSMSASDDDDSAAFNQVNYVIESVEPQPISRFAVGNNGLITLQGSVVEGERYVVTVRASDNGNPSLSNVGVLYLTITSSGNKNPQIREQNYVITVSEGIILNSIVFNLTATDPENGPLTYGITGGNVNSDFAINNVGSISNIKLLDRERTPNYVLDLRVEDNTARIATTKLFITLTDVNDNSPNFVLPTYEYSVDEGVVNRVLGTVNAADADIGQNAVFTYSLLDDRQNLFQVGATSGEFSIGNIGLDYERQKVHYITVAAIDSGTTPRTGTVTVTVNVQDINDNNPQFNPVNYEVSVQESSSIVPIVTVSAKDMDETANVVYKLVDSVDSNAFTINAATGLISSKANVLDFETNDRYVFRVTTNDGENKNELSGTATVTVNILDMNDGVPSLLLNTVVADLLEIDPIGKLISTATATDTDSKETPNGRIVYSIDNSQPAFGSKLFYINPSSGEIVVKDILTSDPARNTAYTLTIKASDEGTIPRSDTAQLTINVRRNQAPVFNPDTLTLPAINVNTNVGIQVGQIRATDPDTIVPFNQVTHTLIGDGSAGEYFQIDNNGNVAVRKDLSQDSSLQFQYTLRVRATDTPGLSDEAVATINVNRNIFTPTLLTQNYSEIIISTKPVNDFILRISASDNDASAPHNTLRYTIIGDSTAQTYLQIASNGDVSLARSVRDTTLTRIDAVVRVSDNGLPTSNTAPRSSYVTINIDRNVNAPIFFGDFDKTIQENQTINVPFLTVFANDSDVRAPFNVVKYRIIGDDNAATIFNINQDNGEIKLNNAFNTDTAKEYKIRVEAYDGGTPSKTDVTVVSVIVTRNIVKPSMSPVTLPTRTILEIQTVGQPFGLTATARDADSGDVEFFLVGDNECTKYFRIESNTGNFYVSTDLASDPTNATRYTCIVKAKDFGTPRLESDNNATAVITVTRNQAPFFDRAPYSGRIDRDTGLNTVVATARPVDTDVIRPFNETTLSIIGDGSAATIFGLRGNDIILARPGDLAAETQSKYVVRLMVKDSGRTSKSAITTVNIDVNRNKVPPQFVPNPQQVTIREDHAIGSMVIDLNATDDDPQPPNNELFYSTVFNTNTPTPNAQEYLFIDAVDGKVYLKKSLLNTNIAALELLVQAQDNGSPRLSGRVRLTVLVIRDEGDLSLGNTGNTINEDIATTTQIVQVQASTGEGNATGVRFEIVGYSDSPDYFKIDANTGVVTAKIDLRTDPSRRTLYMLKVLAYYEDENRNFTATANISITVYRNKPNLGDNLPPEFVYESCIIDSGVCFNPLYKAYVTSNTTGPLIVYPVPAAQGDGTTIIQARDQDSGANQSIVFSVVYTEPQGYENRFSIETTGPFPNPPGAPSDKSNLYRAQLSLISTIDGNDAGIQAVGGVLRVVMKVEEQTLNKRYESAMLFLYIRSSKGDPILDGNLLPPFTGYIMENAKVGSFVVSQDLTEPMRLFISDATGQSQREDYDISMVPDNGIFSLDDNGYIQLANNSIDSEVEQYHDLNVTLTDKVDASNKDTVSVRIFIVDVNDNFPIFNLYSESILSKSILPGNYTQPRFIANVSASDKDVSYSNQKIIYDVDSEPNNLGQFYVNEDGILYLQGLTRFGEVYTVYVSASNNVTPSNSAVIVISLKVNGTSGSTYISISYKLLILIFILFFI